MSFTQRLGAAGTLALAALLAASAPAAAHAVLTASTPARDATVAQGPTDIVLHYNSRIDRGRSVVTLELPDHQRARLGIENEAGPPDTITVPADLRTPGPYVLRWQVLAVDGHITRGDVPFTVK